MAKIVMGYWDCPYCGTLKIKGTLKECPYCGKTKDISVKHYMSGEVEYLDEDDAKNYGKGPDWGCSYCGTANSESDTSCKNCGATREASSKNYFEKHHIKSNDAEYKKGGDGTVHKLETMHHIDTPEIISDVEVNGWVCTYCGTKNKKESNVCVGCGSEKCEEKKEEHTLDDYNDHNYTSSDTHSTPSDRSDLPISENNQVSTPKNPIIEKISSFIPNDKKKLREGITAAIAFVGIAFIIGLLIYGLVYLFTPKPRTLEVNETSWAYTVNIEDYKTYHESGWSIPTGGRLEYSRQEIRSYKQVLDHYETKTKQVSEQVLDHYDTSTYYSDNGDGTFSEHTSSTPVYRTEYHTETYQEPVYRDEPVYDTKYYYEIERWKYARSVKTNGTDHSPYFGETNLKDNERVSSKTKDYKMKVHVIEKDKDLELPLEEDLWKQIDKGSVLHVKMSLNTITEIVKIE